MHRWLIDHESVGVECSLLPPDGRHANSNVQHICQVDMIHCVITVNALCGHGIQGGW